MFKFKGRFCVQSTLLIQVSFFSPCVHVGYKLRTWEFQKSKAYIFSGRILLPELNMSVSQKVLVVKALLKAYKKSLFQHISYRIFRALRAWSGEGVKGGKITLHCFELTTLKPGEESPLHTQKGHY